MACFLRVDARSVEIALFDGLCDLRRERGIILAEGLHHGICLTNEEKHRKYRSG
jgi:hypothetical protein